MWFCQRCVSFGFLVCFSVHRKTTGRTRKLHHRPACGVKELVRMVRVGLYMVLPFEKADQDEGCLHGMVVGHDEMAKAWENKHPVETLWAERFLGDRRKALVKAGLGTGSRSAEGPRNARRESSKTYNPLFVRARALSPVSSTTPSVCHGCRGCSNRLPAV